MVFRSKNVRDKERNASNTAARRNKRLTARAIRPVAESLEVRRLLVTYYPVYNTSDDINTPHSLPYELSSAIGDSDAMITFSLPAGSSTTIQLSASDADTDPGAAKYGPTAFYIFPLGGQSTNITIDGSGAPGLVIDGGGALRPFVVANGCSLTLEYLTVQNGLALGGNGAAWDNAGGGGGGFGGAVFDDGGSFTALGCTFVNNVAQGGDGGDPVGDYVGGSTSGGGGGGFGGDGGVSGGGVNGGAGHMQGQPGLQGGFGGGGGGGAVTVTEPDRTNLNDFPGGGGGFGGGGGGGAGNGGSGGFGGGGAGGGGATEKGSQPGKGGDFGGTGGSGNCAAGSAASGGGGAGLGGGIFANAGSTMSLDDDTFNANSAIGGNAGTGGSRVRAALGGAGCGGAIFALGGGIDALNETISGNTATSGTGANNATNPEGSGIYLYLPATRASIDNCIIGGTSVSAAVPDFVVFGTVAASGSGDLIRNAIGFDGTIVSHTSPDLGPLQNNGGPTQTMALLSDSPAIGAGDAAPDTGDALTYDQRGPGFPRTDVLGRVDIGAYEFGAVPSVGDGQYTDLLFAGDPGGFALDPTGSAWTFTGDSGIAGDGSTLNAGNPDSPSGQVGFLESGNAVISQSLSFPEAGTYQIQLDSAQRAIGNNGGQSFLVEVDGVPEGTITPRDINYDTYNSDSFTVPAGTHTISFVATNLLGGDNTAFIDDVQVIAAAPMPTTTPYWTGFAGDDQWSTPANWSDDAVPAAQDDVTIPAEDYTIGLAGGSIFTIHSLASDAPLDISGDTTLDVGHANLSQDLVLDDGILQGGGLLSFADGAELVCDLGQLNNMQISGNLDLGQVSGIPAGSRLAGAQAYIYDNLDLTGQILIGNASGTNAGSLIFDGGSGLQNILPVNGGPGTLEILFGASPSNQIDTEGDASGGTGFRILPGVTIDGDNGSFTTLDPTLAPSSLADIINEGTIDSNGGGTITWSTPTNFALDNQGTVEASNSSTLDLDVSNLANGSLYADELTGGTWIAKDNSTLEFNQPYNLGAVFSVPIYVINSGTTVEVDGAGSSVPGLGSLFYNLGILNLGDGQNLSVTPSPVSSTFTNDGTISVSAGSTLSVVGSFAQPSDGTLAVQLTSTSSFGSVAASGTAAIDGTLDASATTLYSLPVGSDLQVVTSDGLTGSFARFDNTSPADLATDTTPTTADITVAPDESLPTGATASSGATYGYDSTTNTLSLTSGTLTFSQDLGSGSDLNVAASGIGSSIVFDSSQHLAGITLTGGATATVDSLGAARTHSNHNLLVIGTLGAADDPTFSIDSADGSTLDMEDNDLIIHTGTSDTTGQAELATIQALAATGRNVAPGGVFDGTWDGNGLTSSTAASVDAGLGYEQNVLAVEDLSDMFLGSPTTDAQGNPTWQVGSATENLGANDLIVKYTYNGDLALDGAVDGNAATIFSSYFVNNAGVPATDYAYGDLNGDGSINGNDATIFSSLFGNGTSYNSNGPTSSGLL